MLALLPTGIGKLFGYGVGKVKEEREELAEKVEDTQDRDEQDKWIEQEKNNPNYKEFREKQQAKGYLMLGVLVVGAMGLGYVIYKLVKK